MRRAACLLILLVAAWCSSAQTTPVKNTRQPRILLLVDASSSMLQPWSDKANRFQTAGNIINALMDSIYAVNAGVEFGLRVYGHQSPAQANDCYDTRQEVMFSKNNITQMGLRLASLKPFGVSPIAYSLKEAANNDLTDEGNNAYSILLITDGSESCGGNICEVVKTLIAKKIYFKPYIISLVDYSPLRDQYSCLGNFLQAAKPEDITTAIHKIVEDYRPMLSMPIMAVKVDEPRVNTQPVVKPVRIDTVVRVRQSGDLAVIVITRQRLFPYSSLQPQLRRTNGTYQVSVTKPDREYILISALPMVVRRREFQTQFFRPLMHTMALPRIAQVTKPDPEPLKQEFIAAMTPSGNHMLRLRDFKTPMPRSRPLAVNTLVAKPEWEKPVADQLALLAAAKGRIPVRSWAPPASLYSYAYIISAVVKADRTLRDTVVAVPPTAPAVVPRRDTPTRTVVNIRKLDPVVSPVQKPATVPTPNKPKELSFEQRTEAATETSLAIYFTDGKGKFYATSPQLQLLDAATGKMVKQFHRTVDAAGNPDPQQVPPGNYNLLIMGRANMLMRSVKVEANKKNMVAIKVTNGSLRFRYIDAPNRPVTEFEAIVNIRFEPGPTVRQRCTSELDFMPGNYYIEVNTLPITRHNVDIDFGATTEIQIPEPGYLQFTNQTPKGRVQLFRPLGDKFVPFHELNVTGSIAAQKLRLMPGVYEAHWMKNPNLPNASATVDRFVVKSNSITEMELQ